MIMPLHEKVNLKFVWLDRSIRQARFIVADAFPSIEIRETKSPT